MQLTRPAIFYSFRRCPYAMRARLAVCYSQIEVEIREVVLNDKPTSLLAYSPKGTVPVLVIHNNKVIDESRDIMQWALAQNDGNNWRRQNQPHLQTQISSLIDENDNEFKAILDKYKYADRHPEFTAAQYREQGCHFLNQLELLLRLHHNLISEDVSLADMAIFPFIRQFASVDKVWFEQSPYPKLRTWLARHTSSKLFTDIMYKYPQWSAGDKAVYFTSEN